MPGAFDPYHKWLGIPPAEQPPNHYRLLGVTLFESDPDVIANAAEQRIVHVRAYQIGKHSDESQRILKEISEARVCLLNADKKAEYDAHLRSAAGAFPAAGSPAANAELGAISSAIRAGKHSGPRTRRPIWLLAVCGSVVAAAVIAVAIGLLSGGNEDASQTAAKPPAVEPTLADVSKPSPDASLGGTKPPAPAESKPAQADQPAAQDPFAPKPTGDVEPKESGVVPASSPAEAQKLVPEKEPVPAAKTQSSAPPPPTPPETPPATSPVAETLEQAERRLNAGLAQASTAAERQRIGQETLKFADKAILDSQAELAKRLAVLALRAARESKSADLVGDATMRMIELDEGISDALKDKARQRLDQR